MGAKQTNYTVLIGRLTKDPEIAYAGETKVASYTLAVSRGEYKNKKGEKVDGGADFIRVKAFGARTDIIEKYQKKGDLVCVEGRIHTGSYEKNGTTFYTFEIILERMQMLGSAGGNKNAQEDDIANIFGDGKSNNNNNSNDNSSVLEGFMNIPEGIEDSLPFA